MPDERRLDDHDLKYLEGQLEFCCTKCNDEIREEYLPLLLAEIKRLRARLWPHEHPYEYVLQQQLMAMQNKPMSHS